MAAGDLHRRRFAAVGRWRCMFVVLDSLAFAGTSPEDLAVPLAFAGGAVLASVIDTIAPEAFKDGGPYVALARAAGFFCAFPLSH